MPNQSPCSQKVSLIVPTSHWSCIYGNGCQGVLTEPAPELAHGCCSYGVHASGPKDQALVMSLFLIGSVMLVLGNLLSEILLAIVDPRVSYA